MDEQGRWMARLMEASLQSSSLSEREVEERLGWEPGALGRMLDGAADCGPRQLLAILAELGSARAGSSLPLPHGERGTRMVQDLIERFHRLGYSQLGAASITPPPVDDEIERTVEDVLQRTFGDLGKGRRDGR